MILRRMKKSAREQCNKWKDLYDPTKPTEEPVSSTGSSDAPISKPIIAPFKVVMKSLMSTPIRPLLDPPAVEPAKNSGVATTTTAMTATTDVAETASKKDAPGQDGDNDDDEDIYDPTKPTDDEFSPPPPSPPQQQQKPEPAEAKDDQPDDELNAEKTADASDPVADNDESSSPVTAESQPMMISNPMDQG